MRLFKEGYYDMLQPLEDDAAPPALIDELYRQLAFNEGQRAALRAAMIRGEDLLTIDDQIAIFLYQYPGGFLDPAWVEEKRRADKRRKRHREPAAERALRNLDPELLQHALDQNRYVDAVAGVVNVWRHTDLVAIGEVKALAAVVESHKRDFLQHTFDLLHGEGSAATRFNGFVGFLTRVLDKRPSWRLATCLPALYRPSLHVCVRRTTFREQAKTVRPEFTVTDKISFSDYEQLLVLSRSLRGHLQAAELAPRDLLDVHDFIAATLTPKARSLRGEAVQSAAGDQH